MKNLVIGSTSQLGRYFPEEFEKISSRNIDLSSLRREWDTVYICFAEQRTYLANEKDMETQFMSTNYDMTKEIVEELQPYCKNMVFYSTAQLWDACVGPISLETPFKFEENHYTLSKLKITERFRDKSKYPKVSIAYPFNFNSIHRKGSYLFGKIFRSLVGNESIEIGDTYFYRELLHPKMVVDASVNHTKIGKDFIIGSGRVVYINDFIRNLYSSLGRDYISLVKEDINTKSKYRTGIFYNETPNPFCDNRKLLQMTVDEIKDLLFTIESEKEKI